MDRRFFRPSEFAKLVGLSEDGNVICMNGKRNLTAEEYVAICNAPEVDLDFFTKQEEVVQ